MSRPQPNEFLLQAAIYAELAKIAVAKIPEMQALFFPKRINRLTKKQITPTANGLLKNRLGILLTRNVFLFIGYWLLQKAHNALREL